MKKRSAFKVLLCLFCLVGVICNESCSQSKNKILKAEFHLRPADNIPSIDVYIDFVKDSNYCVKQYDEYPYGGKDYILNQWDFVQVRNLLENADLSTMQKEFDADPTDFVYPDAYIETDKTAFTFPDNSHIGDPTLKKILQIVFKY